MNKIAIIEDTNVVKVRLENLFNKNGLGQIEDIKGNMINPSYIKYMDKEMSMYVIDLDNKSIDGLKLITMIRQAKIDKPIIALSKKADVHLLKKAVNLGCNDFIIKPFEDQSVVFKTRQLFGLKTSGIDSENTFKSPSEEQIDEVDMSWNKDFIIGVDAIDEEHKEIIDSYEKLYKLMKAGKGHAYYNELLDFLDKYVHNHFSHEQDLHKESDYPERDHHRNIHEEFKASVKRIHDAGQGRDVSNSDLIKINLFLKKWLVHHILVIDMKYGRYLEARASKENQPVE